MSTEDLVHVVDDDDAVRDALVFLLGAAGLAARSWPSGEALLADLTPDAAGCVLSDVRMPGMSGLDLLKRLRVSHPHLPVVVITGHGDVSLAVEAMKAGAANFIEKPFDDEALIGALNSALGQARAPDGAAAERAIIAQRLSQLSARERQVLSGVVRGLANKVIAADLGISPRTVEVYRANLMSKMNARNLSDLVRMTLRLDPDL
ncbi:MAG TPA: response regulator FixJ [Caulobacteraceae bacterium]|jgi:two-component system response regulator FixJ|nr:response regulator FixJ [Caulobacteraceae bacterium]